MLNLCPELEFNMAADDHLGFDFCQIWPSLFVAMVNIYPAVKSEISSSNRSNNVTSTMPARTRTCSHNCHNDDKLTLLILRFRHEHFVVYNLGKRLLVT